MKMKLKREILAVFFAVMFVPLTCAGGFADMDAGSYTLGGYISLGGGWLSDQPRSMNRGYLKKYVPFPEGFLAGTDLSLKSKEGLDYYRFRMSHPGLRDQDFLLQAGILGRYHAEIEYDQLQNLYCTVNPNNNEIGIVLQRLRFSGWYTPVEDITLFAENNFLRRTGTQPLTYEVGPGNPYNFYANNLRPIDYKQNDLKVGAEYDQPTDQKSIFQGRLSYHLSTFDNGQDTIIAKQPPVGTLAHVSLPPGNMANYVTGEGALDLKSYLTRITGSFSYGWLSQNEQVFDRNGVSIGEAGLGASTVAASIAGITRPIAPLSLRYGYRAYSFENNNTTNQILRTAFPAADQNILNSQQYSYFRQAVDLGADYRVNNMMAFTLGYDWKGDSRSDGQGRTSSHSPKVGVRLSPTNWLSLIANYAFTTRTGSNFLFAESAALPTNLLTYKFYAGSLTRNNFNFIAEVYPVNTVTCSFNFSIYNDNFTDSTFGIQSDQGWSTGVDVGWRPHDRVALSFGYDHQQLQTKERAITDGFPGGGTAVIQGDWGPTLTTSDAYDTFFARADIKLIPKKLNLTAR